MMMKKRGFTLIELLMVIVFLAILFGSFILFMSQSDVREANLKSTAENTAQIFRNIRNIAIARNTEATVLLPASGRNEIKVVTIIDTVVDTIKFSLPSGYNVFFGQKNGVPSFGVPEAGGSLTTTNPIIFTSSGGCLTPTAIYLSDGKNAYAIGIARSGRIKIWRWGGGRWF